MNISEETLETWAKGPGKTEQEKCDNAETAVRNAIKADLDLAELDITVFPARLLSRPNQCSGGQ